MVYQVLQRTPHSLRVARLYRRVLKEQRNWIPYRHQFNEAATNTRNAFRDKENVDKLEAERLIKDCEEQLEHWRHPVPIISKFYFIKLYYFFFSSRYLLVNC